MTAELLARAARVLREHAEALPNWSRGTGGPWFSKSAYVNTHGGWPVAEISTQAHYGEGADKLAAYIALTHPPVALALAQLLDSVADVWGDGASDTAVAVARAVLREEPGGE